MSAPAEALYLKRTPPYPLHRELGAKLIDFGGWEMPVQYQGTLYYGFRRTEVFGKSALVSRTGYTGEDGFELYLAPEWAEEVFRGVLEAGKPDRVVPCGLGARDALRLEAKMALYGNDIDDTITPWEADLDWIVKMKRSKKEVPA